MHTTLSNAPDACVLVIFGASGDLTQRKLIPALVELDHQGRLPSGLCVLGISRTEMSDAAWREKLRASAEKFAGGFSAKGWDSFARRLHYQPADAAEAGAYGSINARIRAVAQEHGGLRSGQEMPNILFYLSVAPQLYEPIIDAIGASGLVYEGKRWCSINASETPWQRIIVEKPFGTDLASATNLNRVLGRVFEEESIYRIDHYLGKELVQNILVMRFANTIFEPMWSNAYVDHVQVTAAESVGVGRRAGNFYDGAGAVRDMIQSHLLQVLALVAMEPPSVYDTDAIRREKIKVINTARVVPVSEAHQYAVLGRYGASGDAGDDDGGKAYTELDGVDAARRTETYGAVRVHFDNWRWSGVPFYLRSGKKMARKLTEIVVQFKQPPVDLFRKIEGIGRRPANRIIINIAPEDGVSLRFEAKVPGPKLDVGSVKMDMDYTKAFNAAAIEAYGPLMLDAMRGDQTLYKHRDEVEIGWRLIQPMLESERVRAGIETYAAGSWGPAGADELLARDGRAWHNPAKGETR
ncbi:MAG: glucose-6-phosphate dehydrogenase [Planctomycetota bacterium]|nr:glucose-6-phosphate dehydrogenase [Planctomycetota bacterium]